MWEFLIIKPLSWIISNIYGLVHNYGLTIIIFTIIVKMLLLPLNIKSQKSMRKQQKIQPILAQLQEKYKNDQEKLQREMMKLYRDNNISLAGGCLPMLIQMPILIGLYQVIQKPLEHILKLSQENELLKGLAESWAAAHGMSVENVFRTSQINFADWLTLGSHPEFKIDFNFLGLNLAKTPSSALGPLFQWDMSQLSTILLLLIPILAVIASILTNKITMKQSGQTNANDQGAQMGKTMMWIMPIMTLFFTFTFSAGIGIYWIMSSVTQIIQQLVLNYYFKMKGEEVIVTVPELKKIDHGKKRKNYK